MILLLLLVSSLHWEIRDMETSISIHCLICIFILFRPHYNLYLQSIAVNGQSLPIDQGLFATSGNRGTIIDSGTTLAYLVEGAYDPLVAAVSISNPLHACFLLSWTSLNLYLHYKQLLYWFDRTTYHITGINPVLNFISRHETAYSSLSQWGLMKLITN